MATETEPAGKDIGRDTGRHLGRKPGKHPDMDPGKHMGKHLGSNPQQESDIDMQQGRHPGRGRMGQSPGRYRHPLPRRDRVKQCCVLNLCVVFCLAL